VIGRIWDNRVGESDLATNDDGSLAQGDPLFGSAVRSLFTRRRVEPVDGAVLPAVSQGWWADQFFPRPIGSRLWTLIGAKLDTKTLALAVLYAEEALGWWVPVGLARSVSATAERLTSLGSDGVALGVYAVKRDGSRWEHVWEAHLNGL
jgi:phage gp46-like protein